MTGSRLRRRTRFWLAGAVLLAALAGSHRVTAQIDIASDLQQRGFIAYRHGKITVLNPQGLSKCACECYHEIYALARRIFPEFLTAR